MIVIGGGLAGLSSAVALADVGWRVHLFEQRPFLGGRAASFVLPGGDSVDNCQHVTFGCCTNLESFYQRVGVAQDIQFFDRLLLVDPQGRHGALRAGFLPAPFHLAGSFLTFSLLSAKDKLGIARAMFAIIRGKGEPRELDIQEMSMLEWLQKSGQTPKAIERFWRAVLVSALSEELDRIDARYGVQVFWKSVLTTRTGYRMGVPKVELGALYEACRRAIEEKGGVVSFRVPARGLRIEDNQLKAIVFEEGREETADAFVLAFPHGMLNELLPEEVKKQHLELGQIAKIEDASITGVHFWFDREVMKEPYMTLLESTTQWIFNKTSLYGQKNGGRNDRGQYLQLVISASHGLLEKSREEIVDLCLREVRQAFPAARDANLLKSTVIKEAAATFSPRPGVDRLRPKQATPVRAMYLAGDWTATGWPATMEGAVRSGYLAAEAILSDAGTPRRFLQPDLRPEGLIRLWVRGNGAKPGEPL